MILKCPEDKYRQKGGNMSPRDEKSTRKLIELIITADLIGK